MSNFTHYCGLPVHPLNEFYPPHENVIYMDSSSNASIQVWGLDTHWADITGYDIQVISNDLLLSTIRNWTDNSIVAYMSNDDGILAFKSVEEMNMAILKYPEIFINAAFPDLEGIK